MNHRRASRPRQSPGTAVPGLSVAGCGSLSLLLFAVLTGSTIAQAPKKAAQIRIPYDGPEIFARLLDYAGLKPIASFDEFGKIAPLEKTLLVVFGDPKPLLELERRPGGVQRFLEKGGSLLFASDREFSFAALPSLGWIDVAVTDRDLVNYGMNYRNQIQCPRIIGDELRKSNHPAFETVKRDVATNRPGWIRDPLGQLRIVANLPAFTMPISIHESIIKRDFRDVTMKTFVAGRLPYIVVPKKGDPRRVMLFAGHGVFMNCMLVRDDIDNRLVALRTIEWLKEKRTHVLLLRDGQAHTDFKLPLVGPGGMPMPTVELMNKLIDEVQNTQVVQQAINRFVDPSRILQAILFLTTAGAFLFGLRRFFQGRYAVEKSPQLMGIPEEKSTPLVNQRMAELAGRRQMGEPAQALARSWFRDVAKIEVAPGKALDPCEIRAGFLQRRKVAAKLDAVWKLAIGPPPANWDGVKIRGLAQCLEDLTIAVLNRDIVFAVPR